MATTAQVPIYPIAPFIHNNNLAEDTIREGTRFHQRFMISRNIPKLFGINSLAILLNVETIWLLVIRNKMARIKPDKKQLTRGLAPVLKFVLYCVLQFSPPMLKSFIGLLSLLYRLKIERMRISNK